MLQLTVPKGSGARQKVRVREPREKMADDEPDVIINVHRGLDGYGIFFAQREEGMVVTKLDKGSEAEKAGVQPGDRLIRVQDNDGKLPVDAPGRECPVTKEGYQESPAGRGSGTAASLSLARDSWPPMVPHCSSNCRPFSRTQATLEMVRQMKHCKLSFVSKNDAFG